MTEFFSKLTKDLKTTIASNVDSPEKSAKVDAGDTDGKGGTKLSLEKASKEELIEFLKKQTIHTKKIETRCNELFEAYRKVSQEKLELAKKVDDTKAQLEVAQNKKGVSTEGGDESNETGTSESEKSESEHESGRSISTESATISPDLLQSERARIADELQRGFDEVLVAKLSEVRYSAAEREDALLQQLHDQKQNFYAEVERLKDNFEVEREKMSPGSPNREEDLLKKINQFTQDNKRLATEKNKLETDMEDIMQNLNEKLKEIVFLNEEMHNIKDETLKLERKLAKRDKSMIDLREQLEESRAREEENRAKLEEAKNANPEEDFGSLQAESAVLNSASAEEVSKLRNEVEEKEAELFQSQQEIHQKDQLILQLRTEIENNGIMFVEFRQTILQKEMTINQLKEESEIQNQTVNASNLEKEEKVEEKMAKLKQLLALAHKYINEHKQAAAEKQAEVIELQKKIVGLNEELNKAKSDKDLYNEDNYNSLQKKYEQYYKISKNRISTLEQQITTQTTELSKLRQEYQGYKTRAASALKAAQQQSNGGPNPGSLSKAADAETLIRSMGGEIESLKNSQKKDKMELHELREKVPLLEVDLNKMVREIQDLTHERDALLTEKQEIIDRFTEELQSVEKRHEVIRHEEVENTLKKSMVLVKEKEDQFILLLERFNKMQEDKESAEREGRERRLQQEELQRQLQQTNMINGGL